MVLSLARKSFNSFNPTGPRGAKLKSLSKNAMPELNEIMQLPGVKFDTCQ
jgi:hypothetical protein